MIRMMCTTFRIPATTIENRRSVVNSHTVNNSTVYEAQKTKVEIQQDNENQFLQTVQERLSDGVLEQRELAVLNVMAEAPTYIYLRNLYEKEGRDFSALISSADFL